MTFEVSAGSAVTPQASLAVARSLGAHPVGTEPSDSGRQFLVYELALHDSEQ